MDREPSPEFSGEELELIELLKAQSAEDPADALARIQERFGAYVDAANERMIAEGSSPRANLEFNLRLAKIYLAAGDTGQADETLYWVCQDALGNEDAQDVYVEAKRLIESIPPKA